MYYCVDLLFTKCLYKEAFNQSTTKRKEKMMQNRYNELQKKDANLIDELINSIASHKDLNLTSQLEPCNVSISRLAQGIPMGGELDYLDDGTLSAALKARHRI